MIAKNQCLLQGALFIVISTLLTFGQAALTCKHLETSKTRHSTTYEPMNVTIIALHGSQVVTHKDVDFCVIKDGEKCYPDSFNTDSEEYAALQERFSVGYWGLKTTPLLPRVKPITGKSEVEQNFREDLEKYRQSYQGFSCKSGVCAADMLCAPGTREMNGVPKIKYAEIQTGMQRIKRWQQNQKELKKVSCNYYNERFSSSKKPAFPALARVMVTNGSDEYIIGHCLLPAGAKCYPQNAAEFAEFKTHMENALVFTPALLDSSLKDNHRPSPTNMSLTLMSWNCESGVCNGKTLTCAEGERKARVWKVYEYNAAAKPENSFIVITSLVIFIGIQCYSFF